MSPLLESIAKLAALVPKPRTNLARFHRVFVGLPHLQTAQSVSFGHHLLAWSAMLDRDYDLLLDCRRRMSQSPLGAAALTGTTCPIERRHTAQMLDFDRSSENSPYSVSDRDFAIEFCAAASLIMTQLSRFSEELVSVALPPARCEQPQTGAREICRSVTRIPRIWKPKVLLIFRCL